jgi:hypothetical protein
MRISRAVGADADRRRRVLGGGVAPRNVESGRLQSRVAGQGGPPDLVQGRLRAVQRSAGNQAASQLVQRDVLTDTIGKRDEPGSPGPAAGATLSDSERAELRRFTGDRITRAFTAFTDACQDNRAAVKEAAKETSDFLGVILEIGIGILVPGLARGIAHLAEELPANASNLSYRLALAAMNEERTKMIFESGIKIGKEAIKGPAEHLAGEDEIDEFLTQLKSHFDEGADKIDGNLPNLTDEELGVTCAAYSPSVSGPNQFRAAVHDLVERFQRQVQPIGKVEYGWMNREWGWDLKRVVFANGGKKLAVVEWGDRHGDEGLKFREFVEPSLRELALEKWKATPAARGYGEPEEIPASHIDGVPMVYQPDPEQILGF